MRSNRRRQTDNEGVALIATLGITLMLTLVALALAYRSGLFVASSRALLVKTQDLYATEAGLNEMRHFLWERLCVPPLWTCLPGVLDTGTEGGPRYNTYADYTTELRGFYSQQLKIAAGNRLITLSNGIDRQVRTITFGDAEAPSAVMDRYDYRVLAKASNVPKTIRVLAVAERPGQQGNTVVEAALIFEDPDSYEQKNQSLSKSGSSSEDVDTGGAPPRLRANF